MSSPAPEIDLKGLAKGAGAAGQAAAAVIGAPGFIERHINAYDAAALLLSSMDAATADGFSEAHTSVDSLALAIESKINKSIPGGDIAFSVVYTCLKAITTLLKAEPLAKDLWKRVRGLVGDHNRFEVPESRLCLLIILKFMNIHHETNFESQRSGLEELIALTKQYHKSIVMKARTISDKVAIESTHILLASLTCIVNQLNR